MAATEEKLSEVLEKQRETDRQKAVDFYRSKALPQVIDSEPLRETPETQKLSIFIPEGYVNQCRQTTKKIIGLFTPGVLDEARPRTLPELSGLYSAAYLELKQRGLLNVEDEHLFTVLIFIAKSSFMTFGDAGNFRDAKQTTEVLHDYIIGSPDAPPNIGDLTLNLLYRASPVVGYPDLEYLGSGRGSVEKRGKMMVAKDRKFHMIEEEVDELFGKYRGVLFDWMERAYPTKARPVLMRQRAIHIQNIKALTVGSNDDEIIGLEKYYAGDPGGVSGGIDPITGLNITVSKTPSLYMDEGDSEWRKTVLQQSRVSLHEFIHDLQPQRELSDYFDIVVNEMLTDTLAELVQYRERGLSHMDYSEELSHAETGYSALVGAAKRLMGGGILDEDTFMRFAVDQDPKGFMNYLFGVVKGDPEKARIIMTIFLRMDFLPPLKESEMEVELQLFMAQPQEYFVPRFTRMTQMVGYGMRLWKGGVVERVQKNHPEAWEKMRQARIAYWKLEGEAAQKVNPYAVIINPDTDLPYDEVVEEMRVMFNTTGEDEDVTTYRTNGEIGTNEKLEEVLRNSRIGLPVYAVADTEAATRTLNMRILLDIDELIHRGLPYDMRKRETAEDYYEDLLLPFSNQLKADVEATVLEFYPHLEPNRVRALTVTTLRALKKFPRDTFKRDAKTTDDLLDRMRSISILLLSPQEVDMHGNNIPPSDLLFDQFADIIEIDEEELMQTGRQIYKERILKVAS